MHASPTERQNWQLLGDGYAIEWTDLDEHIGIEGLLAGRRSSESQRSLDRWLATQIIEAARRLPRRLYLPYPDKNKLAKDPFPARQDWLGEIGRTTPSARFLLCIDEFARLSELVEATGSRTPLNFLCNVLQHRASWILLFSGSHEPKELPDYWSDIYYKI